MLALRESALNSSTANLDPSKARKIIWLKSQQSYCADCFSPDPEWCSLNLGVFICVACCGIHRHLGTHISRVKSVKLDEWTPAMDSEMENNANKKLNEYYLQHKPLPFKNIESSDPVYLREEIIIEKYVRKSFVTDKKWAPYKVGTVLKRGKYNGKWNERFFRLTNCSLVYYTSQNDIEKELGRIQVDKVWIADGKTGKKFTLQVVGTNGRSLFMAFSDSEDLLEWYNYLRLSKACLLVLDVKPSLNPCLKVRAEYEKDLAASFIVEGMLKYADHVVSDDKQNLWNSIRKNDGWLKYNVVLTYDFLYLYKNPLDGYPSQIIPLQDSEIRKFSDSEFGVVLPEITHYFKTEPAALQRWMHAFLKTK